MNLGKLLGAGKSFISGRKSAAYRANRRVYLPQFVSPKNPFVNTGAAATQDELPKSEPQASLPPDKKSASPWAKAQKMPEVAAPQGATARATTWVSKLNPVSMFRNSSSPVDKIIPPVQVELSLEKIKVVHNDLSDADVEVVPMKSRPARLAPDSKPAKKSWEDLGERILKATAL
ncbi:MAG: hypothetical protein WDM80_17510 [Limisphaerales bacterium]